MGALHKIYQLWLWAEARSLASAAFMDADNLIRYDLYGYTFWSQLFLTCFIAVPRTYNTVFTRSPYTKTLAHPLEIRELNDTSDASVHTYDIHCRIG